VFRLFNHRKQLHHLIIARLDAGKTYDSLLVALKKPGMPPAWVHSESARADSSPSS
jgi:hypothetical protein